MAGGKEPFQFPWVLLAAIVALGAGSIVLYNPLSSSRPEFPASVHPVSYSLQNVTARLWQDPFEAVESASKDQTVASEKHKISEVRKHYFDGDNPKKLLILAVMTNGGPYPEQAERRIRDRVAVCEGLARSGYMPDDAEHIGFFTIPWSAHADTVEHFYPEMRDWPMFSAERGLLGTLSCYWRFYQLLCAQRRTPHFRGDSSSWQIDSKWAWNDTPVSQLVSREPANTLSVPFELFVRNPDEYPDPDSDEQISPAEVVLVLWLRNEAFDDTPLSRLASFLSWFRRKGELSTAANVAVLGPDNSTSLRRLLETRTHIPSGVGTILSNATMYSFRASASDKMLLSQAGLWFEFGLSKPIVSEKIESKIRSSDAGFRLSLAIHHKLLREIGFSSQGTLSSSVGFKFVRTILTDEYLAPTAVRELERRGVVKSGQSCHIALVSEWDTVYGRSALAEFRDALKRNGVKKIRTATYLRGIDGRTANSSVKGAKKDSSSQSQPEKPNKPFTPREAPEGTDQSDYLRRLAKNLESENRTLQFDAVCVLGSDVYDKLQVLRALRPKMTSTIFLTTSLDARLFHPDELRATRNLIVVSAFGLQLAKEYQKDIPPFRDSFQTAVFAGTLCALGKLKAESIRLSEPRIYEIGLDGPIDLTIAGNPQCSTDSILGDAETFGSAHWSLHNVLLGIALLFLLTIVCAGTSCKLRAVLSNRIAVFAAASLVILIFLKIVPQNEHAGEEPMTLLSGISVWPSATICVLAIILSVHFIARALHRLKENDRRVAKEFKLPWSDKLRRQRFLGSLAQALMLTTRSQATSGTQVKSERLWADYCYAANTPRRLMLTVLLLTFYLSLAFLFYLSLAFLFRIPFQARLFIPARGEEAFSIVKVVFWVALLASTFLIFLTIHATWLETRLTHHLGRGRTKWPAALLGHVCPNPSEQQFVDELLDMRFLSKHSLPVTSLVYYPFFTLTLMILARAYFDNWNWPLWLCVVFGAQLFTLIGCVFALRVTAENARKRAIDNSNTSLWEWKRRKDVAAVELIQDVISELQDIKSGSLEAISRQPLLKALLLPSGGAGVAVLLQYISY